MKVVTCVLAAESGSSVSSNNGRSKHAADVYYLIDNLSYIEDSRLRSPIGAACIHKRHDYCDPSA